MKLSARNIIKGKIRKVTRGAKTAHVKIDVGGGTVITASITNEAVSDVDIVQVHREGYETRACIPALAPRAGLTRVANMTAVRSGSSGDATVS